MDMLARHGFIESEMSRHQDRRSTDMLTYLRRCKSLVCGDTRTDFVAPVRLVNVDYAV